MGIGSCRRRRGKGHEDSDHSCFPRGKGSGNNCGRSLPAHVDLLDSEQTWSQSCVAHRGRKRFLCGGGSDFCVVARTNGAVPRPLEELLEHKTGECAPPTNNKQSALLTRFVCRARGVLGQYEDYHGSRNRTNLGIDFLKMVVFSDLAIGMQWGNRSSGVGSFPGSFGRNMSGGGRVREYFGPPGCFSMVCRH